jgi:hypothetical protein
MSRASISPSASGVLQAYKFNSRLTELSFSLEVRLAVPENVVDVK